MEIQDIMITLAKKGVSTSMHYNKEKERCYVDLETHAKSHLHLYEDGALYGRYEYEKQIDLTQDVEDLINELCYEFNNALHGRSYYQSAWGDLLDSKGIKIEVYM